MNLAAIEKRVQSLKARLDKLRPQQAPPPLVIEFCRQLNRNAPEGTRARDDGDDDRPSCFAMIPPGCTEPAPDGVLTFDQWSRVKKGDSKNVQ
jgi:hypothetical protein